MSSDVCICILPHSRAWHRHIVCRTFFSPVVEGVATRARRTGFLQMSPDVSSTHTVLF